MTARLPVGATGPPARLPRGRDPVVPPPNRSAQYAKSGHARARLFGYPTPGRPPLVGATRRACREQGPPVPRKPLAGGPCLRQTVLVAMTSRYHLALSFSVRSWVA